MDSIEAFVAFARMMELRNFSAVGRIMRISQSSVSKHIASLEASFGVQLFVRTTRRVQPTAEAAKILEEVRHFLDSFEQVKIAATGQDPDTTGLLRLMVSTSFGLARVIPLLPLFLERHPMISVDINLSDQLDEMITRGYELAVVVQTPQATSFITRSIRACPWRIVASHDYLKGRRIPESPTDLENHDIIISNDFMADGLEFDSENGRQTIALSGRLMTNNYEACWQLARMGRGIAIVPSWIADLHEGRSCMQSLLPEYFLQPIPVSVVYPQTRYLSHRARSFIDFLVSELRHGEIGDRALRSNTTAGGINT